MSLQCPSKGCSHQPYMQKHTLGHISFFPLKSSAWVRFRPSGWWKCSHCEPCSALNPQRTSNLVRLLPTSLLHGWESSYLRRLLVFVWKRFSSRGLTGWLFAKQMDWAIQASICRSLPTSACIAFSWPRRWQPDSGLSLHGLSPAHFLGRLL